VPLLSVTAANQTLNGLDASGTPTNLMAYTALFSATPGTTGAANEFAGGGYARQASAWNAASASTKTNSGSITWPNAGTVPATHLGTFSAVSAGTYGVGLTLSSAVTAASITAAPGALSLASA
jgi:hypothetical protein